MKRILLDIDGCITDGKGKPVDLIALQALKEAIAHSAYETGLCTGRSALYVEVMAQMLNLSGWCICENGAYLYHTDSEEIVYHPAIIQADLARLATIRQKLTTEHEFLNIAKLELGKEVCISMNPLSMSMTELYEYLRTHLNLDGLHITHSTTAVDITPNNVNKGSALLFLCEREELLPADILGVGDTMGDMPFLELCGRVACPFNAIDEIKSLASFVSTEKSTKGLIDIYQNL